MIAVQTAGEGRRPAGASARRRTNTGGIFAFGRLKNRRTGGIFPFCNEKCE